MSKGKLELQTSDSAAYLTLPNHPGRGTPGCVSDTVRLASLIDRYSGADVYLDFDAVGTLIGIELLFDDDLRQEVS